ncbi:MAG: DNA primase [Flavobacteriales bacterium]|nr:DNA primase [Flavobacteriales bacterium]MBK6946036.1 DNA primase [Flavobacteriales bacterium]MBK7239024.1 DNA primase [Flavobacteriales bacterium]MBK9536870.1 DNA primase [Flavobacteriales bacterium]MBP9139820.1 DNA primase [Flavobacteriales bacterium]
MQRLIRSFATLTDELKEKLQVQFPDGIDSSHIKTVPTAKGEMLRVIELHTADAMYLIKINPESRAEIDEYLDNEDGDVPDDDIGDDVTDDLENDDDDDNNDNDAPDEDDDDDDED